MANVKIYLDPVGNTLNIWWGDPQDAASSEEVSESTRNDIIVKDKYGKPIGLEVIGILPHELNISELSHYFSFQKDEPFLLSSKDS